MTLLFMMFILLNVLAFIVSVVSLHDIVQFEFYFENVMLCTLCWNLLKILCNFLLVSSSF